MQIRKKIPWAMFVGALLVLFCGQQFLHYGLGSISAISRSGFADIVGYSLGLVLVGASSGTYLPPRLPERLFALEAKLARLTAPPLPDGQTRFTVTLEEYPADRPIATIKVIREITGLDLRHAKALVDGAPSTIKQGISRGEAEAIIRMFDETGAKVAVK